VSGAFTPKYTDEQREAVASSVLDRGTTYKRAVELAAAGELRDVNGDKLDPFTVAPGSVNTMVARARKARMGARSTLATAPPRDAVEQLRRAFVDLTEDKLRSMQRKAKRDRNAVSFGEIREGLRVLRELQAIPGPDDERKPAPGAKVNGERNGAETRSGLAGALLKANRQGTTAPDVHKTESNAENGNAAERSAVDDGATGTKTDERPGSLTRSIAAVPA
jgi:hypothetical protein